MCLFLEGQLGCPRLPDVIWTLVAAAAGWGAIRRSASTGKRAWWIDTARLTPKYGWMTESSTPSTQTASLPPRATCIFGIKYLPTPHSWPAPAAWYAPTPGVCGSHGKHPPVRPTHTGQFPVCWSLWTRRASVKRRKQAYSPRTKTSKTSSGPLSSPWRAAAASSSSSSSTPTSPFQRGEGVRKTAAGQNPGSTTCQQTSARSLSFDESKAAWMREAAFFTLF